MRLIPALALAAIAAFPAAPAHADDWSREFPVQGRPTVKVETNDGHVTVVTWDRPQVAVHITTRGWQIGHQVEVGAHQVGQEITVTAHVRPMIGIFFGTHGVRIDVQVPRKSDLNVHTGDGGVEVAPMEGAVRVWTGDGSIEARGLRGDVNLRSGDGSIEASDVDGRLVASTGDGHITVHGRFDHLDLSSGDGSVEADAVAGSALAGEWDLHTGDGSMTLRVPQTLKADLDASTGDGHITVDLPVEVQGEWRPRRELRGTLNGGGPTLRLHSGDGSIRLEKI